ncbi:hypothetical protein CAEBREN_04368 [Caenorhabditis brenneri]|uniref:Uncharacterized protein n=1 Tax=Caenorhabditis brenneri TaxID=135651 RepID=G0MDQ7_CAEBE|nr:hypothetical protein CAEBREN_04368 [Caenorhabditis brenneri]
MKSEIKRKIEKYEALKTSPPSHSQSKLKRPTEKSNKKKCFSLAVKSVIMRPIITILLTIILLLVGVYCLNILWSWVCSLFSRFLSMLPKFNFLTNWGKTALDKTFNVGKVAMENAFNGGRIAMEKTMMGGQVAMEHTIRGGRIAMEKTMMGGHEAMEKTVDGNPELPEPSQSFARSDFELKLRVLIYQNLS